MIESALLVTVVVQCVMLGAVSGLLIAKVSKIENIAEDFFGPSVDQSVAVLEAYDELAAQQHLEFPPEEAPMLLESDLNLVLDEGA